MTLHQLVIIIDLLVIFTLIILDLMGIERGWTWWRYTLVGLIVLNLFVIAS